MSNVRRAPPPSGSAPQGSLDALQIVKKKIAAPSGPPPAGMTLNFKAPRKLDDNDRGLSQSKFQQGGGDYDNDESFDDRDDDFYDEPDGNDDDNYGYEGSPRGSRDGDGYHSEDRESFRQSDDRRYDDYNSSTRRNDAYGEYDDVADGKDRALPDGKAGAAQQTTYAAKGEAPSAKDTSRTQPRNINNNTNAVASLASLPQAQVLSGPGVPFPANRGSNNNANNQTRKNEIFNFHPILKSTYRELKQFVTTPCMPSMVTRCYIERNRSGAHSLAPYYSLCADLEDGTGRELIVCKKVLTSRTAHYVFSLKAEDLWRRREQRSRLYLGKLRQVGSSSYVLFDNGICAAPDGSEDILEELERDGDTSTLAQGRDNNITRKMDRDRKADAKNSGTALSEDVSLYRRELAVIHFNTKTRPAAQGVRGMEVCVPAVSAAQVMASSGTAAATVPGPANAAGGNGKAGTVAAAPTASNAQQAQSQIFNLVRPFERIRASGRQNDMYSKSCLVMHEKLSRYDPLSACLVEFKNRAHVASIKNFQLVISDPMIQYGTAGAIAHEQMLKQDGDKDFVFQLAKTTDDCFNMDYRYPLSLLQCFAIAIAR